jgi:hypothetical protein
MLVEPHHYGGAWVFYVIAPLILCGVVVCLWWIARGVIAVFDQTPRVGHKMPVPWMRRAEPKRITSPGLGGALEGDDGIA